MGFDTHREIHEGICSMRTDRNEEDNATGTVMRKRLKIKSHFHGNTKIIHLKIVPLCIPYN